MSREMTPFEILRWEADKLKERKERVLRQKGWKLTCNVPGSYWLWHKEFDGKGMYLSLDHALMMQESVDSLEKQDMEDETGDEDTD